MSCMDCIKFRAEEKKVKTMGRTLYLEGIRLLTHSASYVEFEFVGKRAEAILWSNCNEFPLSERAWIAVFIDDEETPSSKFSLNETQNIYLLYDSKIRKKTKIRIVKLSEAAYAKVGIIEIITDNPKPIVPTPYKERKIEFIGDSITCGYGNESRLVDVPFTTEEENPLGAYAAIVAKNFQADYHLVSSSGIGMISQYVPETSNEPVTDCLMPSFYLYTDASMSSCLGLKEWEKWDSTKFTPDLIVINIGTNDASYTRNIPERVEKFEKEYFRFLEEVRKVNPKSILLCILGVMGQDLCPSVNHQVELFREEYKDERVFFLELEIQKEEDGVGTDGHPSKTTHQKVANQIIDKISKLESVWDK